MCLCSFLETCSAAGLVPVKLSENTAGEHLVKCTQGVEEDAQIGDISSGKGLGPKLSS